MACCRHLPLLGSLYLEISSSDDVNMLFLDLVTVCRHYQLDIISK